MSSEPALHAFVCCTIGEVRVVVDARRVERIDTLADATFREGIVRLGSLLGDANEHEPGELRVLHLRTSAGELGLEVGTHVRFVTLDEQQFLPRPALLPGLGRRGFEALARLDDGFGWVLDPDRVSAASGSAP